MAILHFIGGIFATVALVPAPREQAWRDGSCAFAGKEVRFVRDAALPPEGYRLDIAPDGVTVASVDEAGAFYARQTLKQLTGRTSFDIGQTNRVTAPCGTVTDYPASRLWFRHGESPSTPFELRRRGTPSLSPRSSQPISRFRRVSRRIRLSTSAPTCAVRSPRHMRSIRSPDCRRPRRSACSARSAACGAKASGTNTTFPSSCGRAPRDFEDFKRRMEVHRRRLIADGVNCAPVE